MKKTIFGCTLLIIGTMFAIPAAYGFALTAYAFGFMFVIWGSMDDKKSK